MVKNKLIICKEYHVSFFDVSNLQFYEYEWMLDDIRENQKEKQSQAEAQEKQQQQMQKQMRSNPYGNMKMPAMPSMPKISMPKFG